MPFIRIDAVEGRGKKPLSPMNERNVKTLYDAGVNIGFGTDSGAATVRIPGFAEHRGLELLVECSVSCDYEHR